jgi:hypothetical protein
MIKICKNCNIEYEIGFGTFCTRKCAILHMHEHKKKKPQITKYCKFCGKVLNTKSTFCSYTCSNKERWSKPEYRNKIKNSLIDDWKNNGNERKEALKIRLKEQWNNFTDDEKKHHLENLNKQTAESYTKISKAAIKNWNNKEYRKLLVSLLKESWINPSEKRLNAIKKISQRMIDVWKNPEYVIKVLNSIRLYKDYLMPSGKIVRIQGYEPRALTELLKKYSEDDIIIGVKNINDIIGKILYMDDNNISHRYYPDFYIKSINTIVEVKSAWTYEIHKEKNLAKEQSCLQQGFNFEFMIL